MVKEELTSEEAACPQRTPSHGVSASSSQGNDIFLGYHKDSFMLPDGSSGGIV